MDEEWSREPKELLENRSNGRNGGILIIVSKTFSSVHIHNVFYLFLFNSFDQVFVLLDLFCFFCPVIKLTFYHLKAAFSTEF